ncbi:mercuric transporter MerT family protein [Marinifilum flexuosum]|uniref:Mercuric transport protein MerT n=1 Tax=Marinifilum flexuosum TaxID=1117708 RepID=A0A419WMW2_9BACT|nr:mercuric transporter MerT family protein [Marinifilum flexuosum]RKD96801.1 MerT mercuric transport protein [Marinifilum flexuosum]
MKNNRSPIAGAGAAILAALGSITCCGAPIIAGILASLGIGASQLSFLHAMQPYLISVALISLTIGFYRLYFKKPTACCNTESTGKTPSNRRAKLFLWVVSIFTIVLLGLSLTNSNATKSCCPSQPSPETSNCNGGCSQNH